MHEKKNNQTLNEKLIAVRETFDRFNLISALHSYFLTKNKNFKNLLPPLILLQPKEKDDLIKRKMIKKSDRKKFSSKSPKIK